jgi:hypothetical protein
MPRKVGDGCTFKQRDIKAVIKAARDAGLESYRVEVDKSGTIAVVPTVPGEQNSQGETLWDKLLKNADEK